MGTINNVLKLKFKYLKKLRTSINEPQSSGLKTPVMIGFKFNHLVKQGKSINQPKSSDPRIHT